MERNIYYASVYSFSWIRVFNNDFLAIISVISI